MKAILAGLCCFVLISPSAMADSREEKAEKLIKQLDAKDAKDRAKAAKDLGELTKVTVSLGKPAVKTLVKLFEDKDAAVRAAAVETACLCDEPGEVVAPAIKLLKSEKEVSVKMAAVTGLGVMGESAKDALSTIRDVSKEAKENNNNRLVQACRAAAENISGRQKKK